MTGSIVQSHPWDCPGGPVIKNSTSNAGRAFQWQELKSLLMKVKEGLKLNIHKTKIMASGPSTLWQTNGETMETVTDFIFLCSKIIAVGDCSHEIKRCLPLVKKSYDQPRQHIKKQRHYFSDKGLSSQSYGFSSSSE